ncbi:DNA ligase [Brevibacillus sp. NPDC003359]|uniref:ATP-dependent DNA ligase n=1 Tax=unclassified Brevibacillus TaxID=2684853 RepID=UPI0036A60029
MLFDPLKPMLLSNQKVTPISLSSQELLFEPKYDGYRLLLHKNNDQVRIFTRHGNEISDRLPDIVEAAKANIRAQSVILDCEGVCFNPNLHRPDFSLFDKRAKLTKRDKIQIAARMNPSTLVPFDLIMLDGESLTSTSMLNRKQRLSEIITPSNSLIPTEYTVGNGNQLFEWTLKRGWEGIVVKHVDSKYHLNSRPTNLPEAWVKWKHTKIETVSILGYQCNPFGLLIGTTTGPIDLIQPAALVQFGFKPKEKQEFLKIASHLHTLKKKNVQMIEPVIRCKVEYLEKTEKGMLRTCTFRGFVKDVSLIS